MVTPKVVALVQFPDYSSPVVASGGLREIAMIGGNHLVHFTFGAAADDDGLVRLTLANDGDPSKGHDTGPTEFTIEFAYNVVDGSPIALSSRITDRRFTHAGRGVHQVTRMGGQSIGSRIDSASPGALYRHFVGASVGLGETLELSVRLVPCATADLDGSGSIDQADVAIMLGEWGTSNLIADLNDDGVVGPHDLAAVLSAMGA
jgi:hypothetical protein